MTEPRKRLTELSESELHRRLREVNVLENMTSSIAASARGRRGSIKAEIARRLPSEKPRGSLPSASVTDHAIVRFLERTGRIDLAEIEREMFDLVESGEDLLSCSSDDERQRGVAVRSGDLVFLRRRDHVITTVVTHEMWTNLQEQRK